ncbi:PDZ domain-containing protein [Galactobacter valiniphilus]|uniref:PDZ domain-containing protein n=1 Tax=Galactobacter valiniphilus TaxID=2676122 RepID=A0A399J9D8_9MICC|nr:trypsin-like peptidase domain-containing protein [Galactobacter valiniphilus]RII42211.1 PDZ domain-containing protein [Galactobacter valiniphilus]
MNEQNQQGQPQDNGTEAQAAPEQAAAQSAATQRLGAAAQAAPAESTASGTEPATEAVQQPNATQRLEATPGAEAAGPAQPGPAAGDAARPMAQPMVLPTGPTQRIEPQRVIEEPAQAAPYQQPIQAPTGAEPAAPQAQAYAPAAQAAHGTQSEHAPSGTAWGQQAPYANPWTTAPQATPGQQQSNPYAYPQAWSQAAPAAKAPMSPRKRKALRFGAAGAALALAVTLGAVPGWAFGHQAGIEQGQAQAEAQNNNNPFGNSQNGNSQNGNGISPFDGSQDGQGSDGSDGSNGTDGGGRFQQLPYGDYGNGSTDQGNNSSVEEGTKLDSGLAGLVMIDTTLNGGEGAGTGMILSSDGYVLTNYHVVEASTKVQVTDSTTGKKYTATVVGRDSTHDVALLKLENASGLQTVKTASGSVSKGDTVHAVGNASGEGYLRKLSGSVTATQQSITTQSELTSEGEKLSNLIETDADVVPGYSGGALVNDAGEVVGMTTAASSGNTSATVDGYAIPISEALSIAEQIKNGQSSDTVQIGRGAALGISVLSSDTGQVGGGYGVTVQEIIDGGAVAKSGLKANDTIIGLDGQSVKSYAALKEILAGHQPGDKVELTWLNSDGAQKSATVTLGESSVN